MEAESPGRSPRQPAHATVLEEAFQLSKPPPRKGLPFSLGHSLLVGQGLALSLPPFIATRQRQVQHPCVPFFSHEMASQLCTSVKRLHDSVAIRGLSIGRPSRGEPMPPWENTVVSQTQPGEWVYTLAWQIQNPMYTNTPHTAHERGKNRERSKFWKIMGRILLHITWNYLSFWNNSNFQGFT